MHVVVIGGGFAGLSAAVDLAKARPSYCSELKITVVDPKDFFEVRWAALRAFFDEDIRRAMTSKYAPIFAKHNIQHAQARVAALNGSSVVLDSAEELRFDVCLVTVGATCPTPVVDSAATQMSARHSELAAAGDALKGKSALIIGGGTLGSELAAELRHVNSPDCKVSVVSSGARVCEQMRPGGSKLVTRVLEQAGVDIVPRRRAEERNGKWFAVAKDGPAADLPLEAEEVIKCTGYRAGNDFMRSGDLPGSLDKDGWIKVDAHYRVEGCGGKVFAFGDCASRGDKNAMEIQTNLSVVTANIQATVKHLASGKALKDCNLKSAKAMPLDVTIVTLGPNAGVVDTRIGAFTGLIPAWKNKDMFITRTKRFAGAM